MSDNLSYKLHGGKPSEASFLLRGYLERCIPDCFFSMRRKSCLEQVEIRSDKDHIYERVNYYSRLQHPVVLPKQVLHEHKHSYYVYLDRIRNFRPSTFHKAYYFDSKDVACWFNQNLCISYIPGDVYFTPQYPSIVKSRLLKEDNAYSVVLKLDKLRHSIFLNDSVPFSQKCDQAIFRGEIRSSRVHEKFLHMHSGSSLYDYGVVGRNESYPDARMTPKRAIRRHLDHKFIMVLEGSDVASNLKWVMLSNSTTVMTHPTCEAWFTEGRLVPDYRYIEIKGDLSNLEEKPTYCTNHPAEAELIIRHTHGYVAQFFGTGREHLISLLVMDKYFQMTGQKQ